MANYVLRSSCAELNDGDGSQEVVVSVSLTVEREVARLLSQLPQQRRQPGPRPPAGGEPQSSEPATVIARSCQCDRRTSCSLNGGQISQVVAEAQRHCR